MKWPSKKLNFFVILLEQKTKSLGNFKAFRCNISSGIKNGQTYLNLIFALLKQWPCQVCIWNQRVFHWQKNNQYHLFEHKWYPSLPMIGQWVDVSCLFWWFFQHIQRLQHPQCVLILPQVLHYSIHHVWQHIDIVLLCKNIFLLFKFKFHFPNSFEKWVPWLFGHCFLKNLRSILRILILTQKFEFVDFFNLLDSEKIPPEKQVMYLMRCKK